MISKISSILRATRTELTDWQLLDRNEAGRFRLGPALQGTPHATRGPRVRRGGAAIAAIEMGA